jgi:hypothetical protein
MPLREVIREKPTPSPFKEKVDTYLSYYSHSLGVKNMTQERLNQYADKVIRIIDRNNKIADLLESEGPDGYKKIVSEEIKMKGDAKLGFVYCIDGRIPTIFLAGRFANVWEEPAGLITLKNAEDGGKLPKSTLLQQALHEAVREKRDVLEIFFAHTSTIEGENTCGYMNKLHKDGDLPVGTTDLTAENLRQYEEEYIPAVTKFYNRKRVKEKLEPLSRVGIGAVYETDRMGIVLNYGKGEKQFSTTDYVNKNREAIEYYVGEHLGTFGSMKKNFIEPEQFIGLSTRLLELTKFLMGRQEFSEQIDYYLAKNYTNLSPSQIQALRFTLFRTSALQYLTGLSMTQPGVDHTFTHHNEDYLSISLAGKPVGRFDPKEQVFASNSSDTPTAISEVRLKLGLMDGHNARKPYVLFVSNPVRKGTFEKYINTESETINQDLALDSSLYQRMVEDPVLKARIKDGDLVVVPVLVDQNTGEILYVPDFTDAI